MGSLGVAVGAITPMFIYLALGYMARHWGFASEKSLREVNRAVFRFFFPLMTFNNMYKAEFDSNMGIQLIIFVVAGLLILEICLLIIVPRLVPENSRRGVIVQGISRSNYVILGIPLAQSVVGAKGAAMASVLSAFVVTIFNVTAVLILEYFRETDGRTARNASSVIKGILMNPIIHGIAAAVVVNHMGWNCPEFLRNPISVVGSAASFMAMFVLGGLLEFSKIRKNLNILIPSMICKLILVPIIMIVPAVLLGFRNELLFCVLAVYATPTATVSYTMAVETGGDGELAGQFVVLSTALSVISLFLWIVGLKELGLL